MTQRVDWSQQSSLVDHQRLSDLKQAHDPLSILTSDYQNKARESQYLVDKALNDKEIKVEEVKMKFEALAPQEILKKMEATAESAEALKAELESKWKAAAKGKQIVAAFDAVEKIATAMYREQQQSLTDTHRQLHMERWELELKNRTEKLKQQQAREPLPFTLPHIQQSVLHGIHPSGSLSQRLDSMRKSMKNYKETQETLNGLLEIRKQRKVQIQTVDNGIDGLDKDIRKHYQALIQSQQEMSSTLRKVNAALTISSAIVLCCVPGGQPLAGAALGAYIAGQGLGIAGAGVGIANGQLGEKIAHTENRYQKSLGKNQDIRERLAQSFQKNQQEISAIHGEEAQQRAQLMRSADSSVPQQFRQVLVDARKKLQGNIAKRKESILSKKVKLVALKKDIEELKKTKTERQNALFFTAKKDKKGRTKRKERLQSTKQTLVERNATLIDLEQQLEAEGSVLSQLTQDDKKIKALEAKEKLLAPIKDFFYEALSEEAKRWGEVDKETNIWREEVEKGLLKLSQAREEGREMAYTSLKTMQNLCSELAKSPLITGVSSLTGLHLTGYALNAQTAVGLGAQVYKLRNLCQSWEDTNKALDKALEVLQKKNPQATIEDVINKMGSSFYITKYVIPGIQMLTIGLGVIRLGWHLYNGSPRILSPEERMLKQLGAFIESLSKHMDQKFEELHKRLDDNQQELVEILSTTRAELCLLNQDIIDEVRGSRDLIVSKIDQQTYNENTRQIKKKASKLLSKVESKLRDLDHMPSREEKERALELLMQDLVYGLEHDTTLDINNGLSRIRGEAGMKDQLSPLVSPALAAQNPDIYTGLIGWKLDRPVPSAFLLIELACAFESIVKYGEDHKVSIPSIEKAAQLIERQAQDIMQLKDEYEPLVTRVRKEQDLLVEQILAKQEQITQVKENYRFLWTFGNLVSGLDHKTLRNSIEQNLGILSPLNLDHIFDRISWGFTSPPIQEKGKACFRGLIEEVPSLPFVQLNYMAKELCLRFRDKR